MGIENRRKKEGWQTVGCVNNYVQSISEFSGYRALLASQIQNCFYGSGGFNLFDIQKCPVIKLFKKFIVDYGTRKNTALRSPRGF
jgi:hypothetical protein